MRIFRQRQLLQTFLNGERRSRKWIGFVPTMGALHAGHVSLVELSRRTCGVTVCSIFINPTQFTDPKDLEKYPRNEEADAELLEKAGCDVLYLPDVNDVYPDGLKATSTTSDFDAAAEIKRLSAGLVDYNLSPFDTMLEGASRPGHFKGVANVVKLLLDAVQPDVLFLGQKDYQQVMIIKRLITLLRAHIKVVTGDIVREANGLAMSSRNVRLDELHRSEAGKIYEALRLIQSSFKKMNWSDACHRAVSILEKIPDSELDYLELRNADTLQNLENWNNISKAVVLVAIKVSGVRLIDNVILE